MTTGLTLALQLQGTDRWNLAGQAEADALAEYSELAPWPANK